MHINRDKVIGYGFLYALAALFYAGCGGVLALIVWLIVTVF